MRLVYEAAKVINIPVIGLGGIESPDDIAEYMLAGATAVQVGTAHFVDPRATERLVEGLEGWCKDNRAPEISKLRGSIDVAGTGSK
jgi:dihydroorotate dehydrogenase (NAD+) catalytic subunit